MKTYFLQYGIVCLAVFGSLHTLVGEKEEVLGSPQAEYGTIVGRVCYTGNVPLPEKIMTVDGGTIFHNDLVVDSKSKGLRYVVAVLEDAPTQDKKKKLKPVQVDQRDMIFIPRVVAVQHGQAVRFENNDICNHSITSTSTVATNQFNLFVTASQPFEHVFEPQKHPVKIGCSLHPWMRAWVYVARHPWFAISDVEGKFKIEGVPPGKYTLLLHHPDTWHQQRQAVKIEAGKTVQAKAEWDKVASKGQ